MYSARIAQIVLIVVFLAVSSSNSIDFSKAYIYDLTQEQISKNFGRVPASQLTEEEIQEIIGFRFTADTFKVLAIPVNWIDRPGITSRETLDSLMFSRDVWPDGSVADYYFETSYGQLVMVGEVTDWYDAGSYPGPFFNFESVLFGINPMVDFTQFDGNHDGVVDAVVFIRSGTGEEDSRNPDDIWSHALSYPLGSGPMLDGMHLSRWNTSPELKPLRDSANPTIFSGFSVLNGIRVFAHELGHNFGLPDLYDYDAKLDTLTYRTPNDANDHPVYDWDIMAYYGYGYFSLGNSWDPSHFSGWSKKELGWTQPIEIFGTINNLVIYDAEMHRDSSFYKIYINPAGEEYFLLEYRNPRSAGKFDHFDSDFSCYFWPNLAYGNDSLKRGLLITHIDDGVGYGNDGTPWYPHYHVQVEDAGYNPARPHTINPGGHVSDSAEWWYPYETRKGALFTNEVAGKKIFGPSTVPNSNGYNGATGVIVVVDSMVGDRLYASINNPNLFDADADGVLDFRDNCALVNNPSQLNSDSDVFGDACDNCDFVPNVDQLDADNDGIGNACDNCLFTGNSNQLDNDLDGIGNVCDNCPNIFNPDQTDTNGDGIGDVCCCIGSRGDANGDGAEANILDLTYTVDRIFRGGPAAPCIKEGDVNSDGATLNILDLTYMVDRIFRGGPAPGGC